MTTTPRGTMHDCDVPDCVLRRKNAVVRRGDPETPSSGAAKGER